MSTQERHKMPDKPGGGHWRPIELEVARRRAKGDSWDEIAWDIDQVKYQTLTGYTKRKWWQTAYDYFAGKLVEEKLATEARVKLETMEQFRDEEDRLSREGTLVALRTLIMIASGKIPRNPDGQPLERVPKNNEGQPKPPDWQTQMIAAKELLDKVGYAEAKKHMARLAIDYARKTEDESREARDKRVDIEILDHDGEGPIDV